MNNNNFFTEQALQRRFGVPINVDFWHVGATDAADPLRYNRFHHMPVARGAGQVAQAGDYFLTLQERIGGDTLFEGGLPTSKKGDFTMNGGALTLGLLATALLLYHR
jgi:hypothetical protein